MYKRQSTHFVKRDLLLKSSSIAMIVVLTMLKWITRKSTTTDSMLLELLTIISKRKTRRQMCIRDSLKAGESVLLSGTMLTGRDAAHKRLFELIEKGENLPAGPTAYPGFAGAGPT